MADSTNSPIVTLLKDKLGNNLRGIAHYDNSDHYILYRRDDVTIKSEEWLENLFEFLRAERDIEAEKFFNHGYRHATIHLLDESLIIHITHGNEFGTVIGLSPAAGSNLTQFMNQCLNCLDEYSPQTIESTPGWEGNEALI